MKLKIHWVKGVSVSALAVGIALMPLAASAQTKKHVTSKKHKTTHSKKAHRRTVHHTAKAKKHVEMEERAVAAPVAGVQPAIAVAPAGPVAGKIYDENAWREFHSDWNGQYFFSSGKYYYDQDFKYPAQIPNDFNSIAARFGGASILDNDPTLIFSGDAGEMYPVLDYNADRYKSDKKYKLKSAFFGRAYFWRDGARYDRKITVDDKGARCFQFVKHA